MEISRITIPYIGITPINHWNNNTGLYDLYGYSMIFHHGGGFPEMVVPPNHPSHR